MENLIKPVSENKTGRLTFYIFEIASAALAFLILIAAIVIAALTSSFMNFFEYFLIDIVVFLFVYGLGRLIDLSFAKLDKKCNCDENCDCKKEDK